MEFKYEELVENELLIGRLLIQGLTVKAIAETTGMSKRIVTTHIRNMKVKLQASELTELRSVLKRVYPGAAKS